MDDVIVHTDGTFEDHMRDVGQVFDRLIGAGFSVRADKVRIGMRELPYLGFYVGRYGTRPDNEKTRPITEMPFPTDLAGAARYAGCRSICRRCRIPSSVGGLGGGVGCEVFTSGIFGLPER